MSEFSFDSIEEEIIKFSEPLDLKYQNKENMLTQLENQCNEFNKLIQVLKNEK